MIVHLVAIAFAAGCAASAGLAAGGSDRQTVTFQEGVNGYAGTVDLEIWAVSPEHLPRRQHQRQQRRGQRRRREPGADALRRHRRREGRADPAEGPRSTPRRWSSARSTRGPRSTCTGCSCRGSRTATWNSLVAGVTADGLEASKQKDGFTFGKISASTSAIPFDVTDTVQAWVNGAANHGWVFINTGGNGWDFYTVRVRRREAAAEAGRRVHAAHEVTAATLRVETPNAELTRRIDMSNPQPGTWTADPAHFARPTRRDVLRVGWLGGLGLSLGDVLKLEAAAGRRAGPQDRAEGQVGHPHLPAGRLRPHGQLRPEAGRAGRVSRHPRARSRRSCPACGSASTWRRPPRSPTS